MADFLLQVREVHQRFDGVHALRGVSFDMKPGERRLIIGPNGAGKTTLFKVISGEVRPTAGDVLFRNRKITGWPPEATASLGMARSFQHSHLFPELTVAENVALAVMARRRGRWNMYQRLDAYASVFEEAEAALATVGLDGAREMKASLLSHGARRQLEIAMALAQRPALLLLDEPAAGLAGWERARLENVLRWLSRDIAVLMIEHDLDFAFSLADRVTVLHHGEVVAEGSPEGVQRDVRAQEVYIGGVGSPLADSGGGGRVATNGRPRPDTGFPSECESALEPVLRVEQLRAGYGDALVIDGVTLQVGRGELVALLGRNGAGKTTVMHACIGFVPPRSGRVWLEGREVTGMTPLEIARARAAIVPQGRRMFPGMTVEEQLALGVRPGPWTPERVYELFPGLGNRRRVIGTRLSGGEQQMLAVGRALVGNPRVLLLDEPSEGLSPMMVRVIRDVIAALRDGGETILLAEQNLPMALSVADRVVILDRGRVAYEGTPEQLGANKPIIQELLGV